MAWLMDEYHRLEGFQPACVTGKPVALFGAPGREEATGRGVIGVAVAALERRKQSVKGANVVIQGFGNVGRFAALAAIEAGMKVIAISDITGAIHHQQGIDFSDIADKLTVASLRSKNEIDPASILSLEADVLIPAALGGVVTDEIAARVNAPLLIEAANQPVTAGGDAILRARGIEVVPDILANAGGVLGSYFEWTQNIQEFRWPISRFRDELDARMAGAFKTVADTASEHDCSLRDAAFVVAVERVVESFLLRGQVV
jgi:glutamate dehydrogenase (NAD(P)+)